MKLSTCLLAFLLLVFGLLLSGCDSDDSNARTSIEGTWENESESGRYLEITSDTYTIYINPPLNNCYEVIAEDIIEQGGDMYNLVSDDGAETVRITIEGGELVVRGNDYETTYEASSVDVSQLELCSTVE